MKNKALYFQTYFTSCTYKFYVSHHFHCYVKNENMSRKIFIFIQVWRLSEIWTLSEISQKITDLTESKHSTGTCQLLHIATFEKKKNSFLVTPPATRLLSAWLPKPFIQPAPVLLNLLSYQLFLLVCFNLCNWQSSQPPSKLIRGLVRFTTSRGSWQSRQQDSEGKLSTASWHWHATHIKHAD